MSKFKKGDKVERKDGTTFSNRELVATVDYVEGCRVFLIETGCWASASGLALLDTTQDKRDELEAAIKLVKGYEVQVYNSCGFSFHGDGDFYTLEGVLDKLLPIETPQQKKLKELEQQQLAIAAQMKQLRNEL